MHLSDLCKYAEEKYNIKEEHKWNDFPGFSVLRDQKSGKWIALLMQGWDQDLGEEVQRCDIKCGQSILSRFDDYYLTEPFRMKGKNWVGVKFEDNTDEQIVYSLLDIALNNYNGYTLILDNKQNITNNQYQETAISFEKSFNREEIPEKISEMMKLYTYGEGSFSQKCKNFYIQGKFMEDYEDNQPWNGEVQRYFITYHDLRVKELRGYFTWRTNIRKGKYEPISTSLAYLYVYELINGIGTTSIEDTLNKMILFNENYVKKIAKDSRMKYNINRWLFDLCIINNLNKSKALSFMSQKTINDDKSILILKEPEKYNDEEVFNAICNFNKKIESSIVLKKYKNEGMHLFAEVWRYISKNYKGRNIFTLCFGDVVQNLWYPLGNAVYFKNEKAIDTVYTINECRSYICKDEKWFVKSYSKLNYGRDRFCSLFHEADRQIRLYLKTGYNLKFKELDKWAVQYIQAVLENDRKIKAEAARPKININFSGLDKIRNDSYYTRDSLLTEEEKLNEKLEEKLDDDEIDTKAKNDNNYEEIDTKAKNGNNETESEIFDEDPNIKILKMLLKGQDVEKLLKQKHKMPEIVADEINEFMFEYIGDAVIECENNKLILVKDYREEIAEILGGQNNE